MTSSDTFESRLDAWRAVLAPVWVGGRRVVCDWLIFRLGCLSARSRIGLGAVR